MRTGLTRFRPRRWTLQVGGLGCAGVPGCEVEAGAALDTLASLSSRPDLPQLSGLQLELLTRILKGESVDDIAAALYLSSSTIRNRLTGLYRKFGVHPRAVLLAEMLRTSRPVC